MNMNMNMKKANYIHTKLVKLFIFFYIVSINLYTNCETQIFNKLVVLHFFQDKSWLQLIRLLVQLLS
jgi:hypothetical protein